MDVEKLINAVKIHPVLYDVSHSKYMDAKYKTYIWKNIGKELGFDGPACKTRWTNLRDTYRKFLKKAEQSTKKIKSYKYHQQMEFLKPFFSNERDTKDNDSDFSDEFDNTETERKSKIVMVSNQLKQTMKTYPRPSTSRSISPRETLSPPLSSPASFGSQNSKRPRRACKSRSYSQHTAAVFETEHSIATNNKSPGTPFYHPVDAFLLGALSPILKSLPPYELASAKSELFALAQKYEFKMANVNQPISKVLSISEDQNRASTSNSTNAGTYVNEAISPVQSISEDRKRASITNDDKRPETLRET